MFVKLGCTTASYSSDVFVHTSGIVAASKDYVMIIYYNPLASWSVPCLFMDSAYNQPILDILHERHEQLLAVGDIKCIKAEAALHAD